MTLRSCLLLALIAAPALAAEPAPRLSVLIVDGVNNHDWPRATRILKGILEMSMRIFIHSAVMFMVLCAHAKADQEACTPGELRTDSTPTCISIQRHGIRVRKEDIFANWAIPAEPARVVPQHLPLKAGGEAVDVGAVVPNLSDDFNGTALDLGAYELGKPLPHYGPR
jgi:hypothetical protein